MIYIYSLRDPRTQEIRYIGKSIRPKERLMNHLNEQADSWRNRWLKQLRSLKLKPTQEILEELPDGSDWQSRERHWIAFGRKSGWPLTNCTDGGDGVVNLPEESRARITAAWVGRKHKPESLVKIGKASTGRHHTEAHKRRMSELMKGRKITWGNKISEAVKKLSPEQVLGIRLAILNGRSDWQIGNAFSISAGVIRHIRIGKRYQGIAQAELQRSAPTLFDLEEFGVNAIKAA